MPRDVRGTGAENTLSDGPIFKAVDHAEFTRLKRLSHDELVHYMTIRQIDGVELATDPTLRIVT